MKETLLKLLDYEHWANNQLINSLLPIDSPPERAIQIMSHILSVQQVWFQRISGQGEPKAIWQTVAVTEMPTLADTQFELAHKYLTSTDEANLMQSITYRNSHGQAFQNTVQDILLHLSHHAAYHRGQVLQLIRPQVEQVPATDYIFWVRNS